MDILKSITRPTLLINETICRNNIQRMAERAQNTHFRPHFKTHQSAQIGDWCREYGVQAITVSSVQMAQYFAAHGWEDITIAFPVNHREIEDINALARRVKLGLLVDSMETVLFLRDHLQEDANIWLDVDTGYHRTGIAWDDVVAAKSLTDAIQAVNRFHLVGMLTHAGHTYKEHSKEAITAVYEEGLSRFKSLRDQLEMPELLISIGDTPSCSVVDDLSGADEIRPGNFIFYDVMQAEIGACSYEDIAVAVACPIVSKQPHYNQVVVYGGAVHLSKDNVFNRKGQTTFGAVAPLTTDGWGAVMEGAYVKGLSQEHGILHVEPEVFDQFKIGDLIAVLPIHSCLTADLLKSYQTLTGEKITMAPIPAY